MVYVVVHWLLDLDYFVNLDYLLNCFNHLHYFWNLNPLQYYLCNNFRDSYYLLLVEWHLYPSINYLLHLFVENYWLIYYLLNLFYSISIHDLLLNYLHLLYSGHFNMHLHYLFNDLRYFYYLLYCPNYWDKLLNKY